MNNSNTLVIKIGSSLVTNSGKGLNYSNLEKWVSQIATIKELGHRVALVSSGAIAEGMQRLGLQYRPRAVFQLQAAAAVGQMGLIQAYETCFRKFNIRTAQILLTHEDLSDRKRYLNARSTLRALLGLGVVPIINENDTVATTEIQFGDNDTLAALVTNLIEASSLYILTDQKGLLTSDPRKDGAASLIENASASDESLRKIAGSKGSHFSSGGMLTKIDAARRAARSGADTIIASGQENNVLVRLLKGERIGTKLKADSKPLAARRQWLADHLQVKGYLEIDEGAVFAIKEQQKSLLPIGVNGTNGNFSRGDVVSCIDHRKKEIARGLVNYNSSETQRILGTVSSQIEDILGYVDEPELIHRDNMVLL